MSPPPTPRPRRSWGYIKTERSGRYRAQYKTAPGAPYVSAPHTFTSRRDAERWLERTRVDLERGEHRDPLLGTETVTQFGVAFLANHGARLAPSTVAANNSLWTRHVEPAFGRHRLRDVRTSEVRAWIARLARDGYGASTIRHAYGLLSQIMGAAVDDGDITVNPCTAARKSLPRMPEPEPQIITPEQVTAITAHLEAPWDLAVYVMAYSGARIGEVLALRRRSVDLFHGWLVITENATEVNGRQRVGETKTHQQRTLTMPTFIMEALAERLAENVALDPAALLFPSRTGTPVRYQAFRRHWDGAVTAAGLPSLRPYALRASHGSWVAASHGVLAAAARLGHSSASVTTRHYARVMPGTDANVAAFLEGLRPGDDTTGAATA